MDSGILFSIIVALVTVGTILVGVGGSERQITAYD